MIQELKKEFKNYIADGLKIYYSVNRPIIEILIYLKDYENKYIWEKNERVLISWDEILKEDLKSNDLKEVSLNYCFFVENSLKYNLFKLFDVCLLDLNELLTKYKTTEKSLYPLFNDSNLINIKDYENKAKNIYNKYMNKNRS